MTPYGHDFAEMAAGLAAMLQEALEIRGLPESFVPLEGETAVSVTEARDYLEYAIKQIMKQVPNGFTPWFVAQANVVAEDSGHFAQELYANFSDTVAMLTDKYIDVAAPKVPLYELDVVDGMIGVAEGHTMGVSKVGQVNGGGPGVLAVMPALGNKRPLGFTNTWVDQIKEKAFSGEGIGIVGSDRIALPPDAWTAVLSTDGWNTGGPEGFWRGG